VCIVAPSLGILGGQAVQAGRLLERLRQVAGVEVTLLPINPQLPGVLGGLQKIKYLRTLLTESIYLANLALRIRRCDVVHVFSASYFSFVLAPTPALFFSKLYGKPSVLNYHSGQAEDHLRRWRTAVPALRLADEVVVPSGYLVDVFGRFGVAARTISNIVDLDKFRFRERLPLRPLFLANRNFEPLYNVACVLRAFRLIQDRFPAARLTVAGDGSQRRQLEALAAHLGLERAHFVGRVEPERMPELYADADLYLNASSIDNMPVSIIEAFAAGLPVVSTRAGGIPYIVEDGETGVLVDLDDHAAMAAAAIELLELPARAAAIARRAHEECAARYHWQAVRDQWLSLYTSLAGRPPLARDSRSPHRSAAPSSVQGSLA
jgi:glycosyltransferase involved in cell wall biosynthesis